MKKLKKWTKCIVIFFFKLLLEDEVEALHQTYKDEIARLERERDNLASTLEGINYFRKMQTTMEEDIRNLTSDLEREKKER